MGVPLKFICGWLGGATLTGAGGPDMKAMLSLLVSAPKSVAVVGGLGVEEGTNSAGSSCAGAITDVELPMDENGSYAG